eukprot:6199665-Pleurochrysis_carterae.AAC.2
MVPYKHAFVNELIVLQASKQSAKDAKSEKEGGFYTSPRNPKLCVIIGLWPAVVVLRAIFRTRTGQ